MLTKLEIQNYILIDHLSIDLSNQLSVITGETGAGKSIIMGALGLISATARIAAFAERLQKNALLKEFLNYLMLKFINHFLKKMKLNSMMNLLLEEK